MKSAAKPLLEFVERPIAWPSRLVGPPAFKLIFEDERERLSQAISEIFVALTFAYQVDDWLPAEILQRQVQTGGVHGMEPLKEWPLRRYYDSRAIQLTHLDFRKVHPIWWCSAPQVSSGIRTPADSHI